MGRLVDPKPEGVSWFKALSGPDATRAAATRIAKYVPAEVLVPYAAAVTGITVATAPHSMIRLVDLLVAFGLGVVATPAYLTTRAEPDQPKLVHLVVATGSFVAWSYSMGGFWQRLGWYQLATAALVVLAYSLLSGLVIPAAGSE